jgi:putative phage-type endonuclease
MAPLTAKAKARRRNHLCASDTPIVLGHTPFNIDANDIYWSKKAEIPDEKMEEYFRVGNYLEDPLLKYAQETLGVDIQRNQFRVANGGEGHTIMAATHDALVRGKPEGVEAKTASMFQVGEWGDEGTDQVPVHVVIQTQQQMYCSDLERVWVPVAMPGYSITFKMYCVQRSETIIQQIQKLGMEWWHTHVVQSVPPDPYAAPKMDIIKYIERPEGSTCELATNALKLIEEYNNAAAAVKAAATRKEAAKARVVELMGENEIGVLPDGRRATFKSQRSGKVIDTVRLFGDHPEIDPNEYVTQGTHRTFRVLKARKGE